MVAIHIPRRSEEQLGRQLGRAGASCAHPRCSGWRRRPLPTAPPGSAGAGWPSWWPPSCWRPSLARRPSRPSPAWPGSTLDRARGRRRGSRCRWPVSATSCNRATRCGRSPTEIAPDDDPRAVVDALRDANGGPELQVGDELTLARG